MIKETVISDESPSVAISAPKNKITFLFKLFCWTMILIFAFHTCTHMVGAGDTWVALACGRHFVNHGVDTIEPFSANSHHSGPTNESMAKFAKELHKSADESSGIKAGILRYCADKADNYPNLSDSKKAFFSKWHPTGWVNQNWLSHVIFYWLAHESPFADSDELSFNTLVYWKFALYFLTAFLIYYSMRLMGVHFAIASFFTCAALFIGRSFIDIRPAGYSNLFVAIFMVILLLASYRHLLYVWLLVPVTVLWANLHGGYIYIFIMLVIFVVVNFVTQFFPNRFITLNKRGLWHTIAVGIAAFIGSIVFNPFHLTNLTHTFVISFSKSAEMWRTVNEWHPAFEWQNPVGTGFPFLILVMTFVAVVALWLFNFLLKPVLLDGSILDLQNQKNKYSALVQVFGHIFAIFAVWIISVSFSFLDLNPGSFFITAIFAIIISCSLFYSIYYIFLVIPLSIFAMACFQEQVGYSGAYFYPFLTIVFYVLFSFFAGFFTDKIKRCYFHILIVSAVAVIAALLVIYYFDNCFTIGENDGLFSLTRPWRPHYEGRRAINYSQLFPVLYVLNLVCVLIYLAFVWAKNSAVSVESPPENTAVDNTYKIGKINLAVVAIAVVTIYMAICSRRFIVIAGYVACPIIALLLDHLLRLFFASRGFFGGTGFNAGRMSGCLSKKLTLAAFVLIMFFGSWWGIKYKKIYLDPWPNDPKLSSVFMRMTASYLKPFYVCRFIQDNKISGTVFNYWTEGGAIAYGQEPNSVTGKTSLQLFMDGRAQAAYEPIDFNVWSYIIAGGPVAINAARQKAALTRQDRMKIAQWLDAQFNARGVSYILMPSGEFDKVVLRSIKYHRNWRLIYSNEKQQLFANVTTAQGKRIYEGIASGETVYRDQYVKDLVVANNLLLYGDSERNKKTAIEFAICSFEANPTEASALAIIFSAQYGKTIPIAIATFTQYLQNFHENEADYRKTDGYSRRLSAAMIAADFLVKHNVECQIADQTSYKDILLSFLERKKDVVKFVTW